MGGESRDLNVAGQAHHGSSTQFQARKCPVRDEKPKEFLVKEEFSDQKTLAEV